MKIHSVSSANQFTQLKERQGDIKERQGGGQNEFQNMLDQKKKDESSKDEAVEVDEDKVEKAIEQFAADELTQGLQASAVGHGPGLKVVLKDGSGAVVRQLTGEEFLKLRQTVSSKSGKILDQKL